LFQEEAACQEYNSASFGLWITKADEIIDNVISEESKEKKAW